VSSKCLNYLGMVSSHIPSIQALEACFSSIHLSGIQNIEQKHENLLTESPRVHDTTCVGQIERVFRDRFMEDSLNEEALYFLKIREYFVMIIRCRLANLMLK
jgi:hypothetical protein